MQSSVQVYGRRTLLLTLGEVLLNLAAVCFRIANQEGKSIHEVILNNWFENWLHELSVIDSFLLSICMHVICLGMIN